MNLEFPSKELVELLGKVARGRTETTLSQLIALFPFPEEMAVLEKADIIRSKLTELGLCLIPGFEAGDFQTIRCIDFARRFDKGQDFVLEEVARTENPGMEFKSSLLYDHDKAKFKLGCRLDELRSEEVLHSALKSIAAFLNSDGGVVYIGVGPSGNIVGLELDFRCANEKMSNADGWELALRDFIQTRFKDGATINQYVFVEFVKVDGQTIARLEVTSRTKLSFLVSKGSKSWILYRRDGNRTIEVTIDQVEEYIALRTPSALQTPLL